MPLNWATTQNNLGTALQNLGGREAGTERLEEAVAAYRDALKEQTRDRASLGWATTQNNLGNALQNLGARQAGTALHKVQFAGNTVECPHGANLRMVLLRARLPLPPERLR